MSDFDLVPPDSGGGEVAPYSPTAPLSPSTEWMVPEPDFISEQHQQHSAAPTLFGQPVQAGATLDQIDYALDQIAGAFTSDMQQLGMPQFTINSMVSWFKSTATKPVQNQRAMYSYNMAGFSFPQSDLPHVVNFLNHCEQTGIPEREVKAALTWLVKIGQQQQPQQQQKQTGGEISDAEWAKMKARNAQDIQNCENILRNHWGHSYDTNIGIVAQFFNGLPLSQREQFLDSRLPSGVQALNDPTTIAWMFDQAIGGLPTGAALQSEIASIEKLMKANSPEYWRSPKTQARYRELLTLRDG